MQRPKSLFNRRLFFSLGLLFICIIYTIFNIFLGDDFDHVLDFPKELRHIFRFGTTLLVYLIGRWVIKREPQGKSLQIWRLVYASLASLLLVIGLYDWCLQRPPLGLRSVAAGLQLFLISPIPYVAVRIIDKYVVT